MSSFIRLWQEQWVLYTKTNNFFWYLAHFFLEWEIISDKSCGANQNTHFRVNFFFFFPPPKIVPFVRYVEKCCTPGQATDDSMAHAHCMLDARDYKHTLSVCNTYCFSTAIMVARSRVNVTLYYVACRYLYVIRVFFFYLIYLVLVIFLNCFAFFDYVAY